MELSAGVFYTHGVAGYGPAPLGPGAVTAGTLGALPHDLHVVYTMLIGSIIAGRADSTQLPFSSLLRFSAIRAGSLQTWFELYRIEEKEENILEGLLALSGILLACAMGTISPGPSFLLVARISISESRGNGLAAAVGMGVGGTILAILALLGLKAVFSSMPILYNGMKILGGIYLVYIGLQMWRGASSPLNIQETGDKVGQSCRKAFGVSLFTQLSNPKTIVFYGSIFAALLPAALPPLLMIALPICVFLIETGWYAIVAMVLSSSAPRAVYLRAKPGIDRAAGGLIGLLGIKLAASLEPIG